MREIIIAVLVLIALLTGGLVTGLLTAAFTNPLIGFGGAVGLIVRLIRQRSGLLLLDVKTALAQTRFREQWRGCATPIRRV